MKPSRARSLAIAVAAVTALVTGYSNGSDDQSSSSDTVANAPEQIREPQELTFKPIVEPDEDKDAFGLRLVEKPPLSDYSGPEIYATCNFKNNTHEVSDYYAEAIVTSPKGYDPKQVWFKAENVPPGKTVSDDYHIGADYDLTEWEIHFSKIDRTSNEEGQRSDDNAGYSLTLVEKQVGGAPQVTLDWEVTNNADGSVSPEPSGYLVKYQIVGTDESGAPKVLNKDTLTTKGLEPGTDVQPGETQKDSISMEKVVQGENFTVSETGEVQGLSVIVTDIDRIRYVQQ
jgi:hypothetical protein